MPTVTLLGSDGLAQTLGPALQGLAADAPVALLSAGWQEWERDAASVRAHCGCELIEVGAYAAAARVLQSDPALARWLNEQQRQVRAMQADYRVRLAHAAAAVLQLPDDSDPREAHRAGVDVDVDAHRRDARTALRALDRRHLSHLDKLNRAPMPMGETLAEERARAAAKLSACAAVLIAGGHVAVLRNRMRLLDLDAAVAGLDVIAWGAGAMVATERVVVSLNRSPRGAREPEVLDRGLGLVPRLVVVPDARARLRLGDRARMGLLARRFAPSRVAALDGAAMLRYEDGRLAAADGAFSLSPAGRTPRLRPA